MTTPINTIITSADLTLQVNLNGVSTTVQLGKLDGPILTQMANLATQAAGSAALASTAASEAQAANVAAFAPWSVPAGTTYTVPDNAQALTAMNITVDGILQADGYLIEI